MRAAGQPQDRADLHRRGRRARGGRPDRRATPTASTTRAAGRSRTTQRSVEQEKLNHLGHALDTLFTRFKRHPFDHLVVGAPDELVGEVEERLHPYLRARLAGRLGIDVENSSAGAVQAAAAEVVERHVAAVEREALDRMAAGHRPRRPRRLRARRP